MAEKVSQERFQSIAGLMRAHGVIAIVFGGLGTLFSLFIIILSSFAITEANSYQLTSTFVFVALLLIFVLLPHLYLVISGTYLLRNPDPKLAKVLTITNLVVGVFYNLIVLIFAIISLTQLHDYEAGYLKATKATH